LSVCGDVFCCCTCNWDGDTGVGIISILCDVIMLSCFNKYFCRSLCFTNFILISISASGVQKILHVFPLHLFF
jgi:hypothetical protein